MNTLVPATPLQKYTSSLFLWGIALAFPLAFVPISVVPGSTFRAYLLLWMALMTVVLWTVSIWREKRVTFWFGPITWVWSAILILALLSSLTTTTPLSQIDVRVWSLAGLAGLALFLPQLVPNWSWKNLLTSWLGVGWLVSAVFWWQLTPWPLSAGLEKMLNLTFSTPAAFTLLPSLPALMSFLAMMVIAAGVQFWVQGSSVAAKKTDQAPAFLLASLIFLGVTFIGVIYQVWNKPELRPPQLPYTQGWIIAVEQFKSPRSLLLGVGPERFQYAFNTAKTAQLNATPLWSTPFSTSSSQLLEVATTLGLPALGLWLFGFFVLLRTARAIETEAQWPLISMVALQAIHFVVYPYSVLNYGLLAALTVTITVLARRSNPKIVPDLTVQLGLLRTDGQQSASAAFPRIIAGAVLAAVLIVFWWSGRTLLSEWHSLQAIRALNASDGLGAYQHQRSMVLAQPYRPMLRAAYAETNFALARNILTKEQPTEEERNTAVELLKQAIREARVATEIEPAYADGWALLGAIYAEVRDTEGASDWALAALTQSARLNPTDPRPRVNLANFFRVTEDLNQASRLYEQAIELKPDWNISYFLYADLLLSTENETVLQLAYNLLLQSRDLTPTSDPLHETISQRLTQLEPQVQELAKRAAEASQSAQQQGQPTTGQDQPTEPSQDELPNAPVPENEPNFGSLLDENASGSGQTKSDGDSPQEQSGNGNIVLPDLE